MTDLDTSWAELVAYDYDPATATLTATLRDRDTGRTFTIAGTVTAVERDEATT